MESKRKPLDIRQVQDTMSSMEDNLCNSLCDAHIMSSLTTHVTQLEHFIDVNRIVSRQYDPSNA